MAELSTTDVQTCKQQDLRMFLFPLISTWNFPLNSAVIQRRFFVPHCGSSWCFFLAPPPSACVICSLLRCFGFPSTPARNFHQVTDDENERPAVDPSQKMF